MLQFTCVHLLTQRLEQHVDNETKIFEVLPLQILLAIHYSAKGFPYSAIWACSIFAVYMQGVFFIWDMHVRPGEHTYSTGMQYKWSRVITNTVNTKFLMKRTLLGGPGKAPIVYCIFPYCLTRTHLLRNSALHERKIEPLKVHT